VSTSARVRITGEDEKIGDELPFNIEYRRDIEARKRRYSWNLDGVPQVLYVLADHPSVKPFYKASLGPANRLLLTPELRTVTREIAASAVAYRSLEERTWSEDQRPEAILAEYEQVLERALRHLYS